MEAKTIIEASNLHDLKSLGSYRDLKKDLESEIDNKLGVLGWETFFEKIKFLKEVVSENKDHLLAICDQTNIKESKIEVSKILKLNIKAKSWSELSSKINIIISIFGSSAFDPYEYYEKTKFKKFQSSSKLEGIDIEIPDENTTLESVLAKYRR